jgi:hypothetical protein
VNPSSRSGLVLAAALAVLGASAPVAGQDAPLVGELSHDSVGMADVFELRVRVDVPPGTIVYFPDTLPATPELESFAPVEWREASRPDGGATLTLTYRLIPFGTGLIPVPPIDAVLAPVGPAGPPVGAALTEIRGGSFVGAWEDGRRRSGSGARRQTFDGPRVRVTSVQTAADHAAGVQPRGPDDVMGPGWSWPNLVLFLLFSSVIVGAAVTAAQDWLRGRRGPSPIGPGTLAPDLARREALAELERLLGGGPWPREREAELYASSSAIVRRYAAQLDPEWGLALTSSELMTTFATGRHADATSDRQLLETEMERAERVKFGRLRAGPEVANAHLAALRASLAGGAAASAGAGRRGTDA